MSKVGNGKNMKPGIGNGSNSGPGGAIHGAQPDGGVNGTPVGQQTNPIPTTQPTDSYIPSYLSDMVPELRLYEQLLDSERRIDVYLARKKIDLHQSVSQWNNSKTSQTPHNKKDVRYLRVFVSNIAENQPWQNSENEASEGSWTMRIEGRLLDDRDVQDSGRPKFSSFLQAIAVDFKKPKKQLEEEEQPDEEDATMGGVVDEKPEDLLNLSLPLQLPQGSGDLNGTEGTATNALGQEQKPRAIPQGSDIADAVEWHLDPKNPVEFDGLDIKRPGSENVDCTITIQQKGLTGEDLEYSPQLAALIGVSHGSLHEAVYSLYKYILMNELLVNDETNVKTISNSSSDSTNGEKTMVQLDESLQTLVTAKPNSYEESRVAVLKLSEIPPLINAHISPTPPVKIDYTIRVDKASTYGELVFDLEVPNQTRGEKSKDELAAEGVALLTDFNKLTTELQADLQKLDARTNALQLQLNASANKYQFYHKLAQDPTHFLQEYMASTASALKVLSGDEGFNEDTVRGSQFYKENETMLFENLGVLLANGRM